MPNAMIRGEAVAGVLLFSLWGCRLSPQPSEVQNELPELGWQAGPMDYDSLHRRVEMLSEQVHRSNAGSDPHYLLAYYELLLGRLDLMEQHARVAVELHPLAGNAEMLSAALYARGHSNEAVAVLQGSVDACHAHPSESSCTGIDSARVDLLWLSIRDLQLDVLTKQCDELPSTIFEIDGNAVLICELGEQWAVGDRRLELATAGTATLGFGPRPHDWITTAQIADTKIQVSVSPSVVFSWAGKKVARSLGITLPSDADVVTWIPTLEIGSIVLRDVPVILVAELPDELIQLQLGTQVLRQLGPLSYDFAGGTFALGKQQWTTSGEVPMRWLDLEFATVPVFELTADGRALWFVIDTPTSDDLVVNEREFVEARTDTDEPLGASVKLSWAGATAIATVTPEVLHPLAGHDFTPQAGLGRRMLSRLRLTMDPSSGRATFTLQESTGAQPQDPEPAF
jgi:hypothetical protein